jgi:uncharacterized protein DUF6232
MQMPSLIQHSAPPPPGEICAACGRVIGELEQPFIWQENVVCFGCHRDLSQEPTLGGLELAGRPTERVFLSDSRVQISRSQVVVDAAAYAVADVRFARLLKSVPKRAYSIVAAIVGLIIAVFGLNRSLDRFDLALMGVGAVLVAGGVITAVARRTKYSVLLDVNGTEVCLLTTTKGHYAQAIVDAVGEAVIERGQFLPEAPPPQLGLPPVMRAQLRS